MQHHQHPLFKQKACMLQELKKLGVQHNTQHNQDQVLLCGTSTTFLLYYIFSYALPCILLGTDIALRLILDGTAVYSLTQCYSVFVTQPLPHLAFHTETLSRICVGNATYIFKYWSSYSYINQGTISFSHTIFVKVAANLQFRLSLPGLKLLCSITYKIYRTKQHIMK